MARLDKKILYQGLKDYTVYKNDTDNSVFNVKNIPETFPQGKSYFLILGSKQLRQGTDVLIEILDSRNQTIYYEIPYYLEATGRAVSVWIYDHIVPGKAQVTILGELIDVPEEWKNTFNVKYQFDIFVNPQIINNQQIKFSTVPVISTEYVEKGYVVYTSDRTVLSSYTSGSAYGTYINPDLYKITLVGGTTLRSFEGGSFYASNLKYQGTSLTASYSGSITTILNDTQFYVIPGVSTHKKIKIEEIES